MFHRFLFSFESLGPLGINLKSCVNGYGAFLDSFYETNSLAETVGLKVGDVLVALNDISIILMDLDGIKAKLVSFRHQPLTIVIERLNVATTEDDRVLDQSLLYDIRHRLFIKKYFKEKLSKSKGRREAVWRTAITYDCFCKVFELQLIGQWSRDSFSQEMKNRLVQTIQSFEQILKVQVKSANEELTSEGLTNYYLQTLLDLLLAAKEEKENESDCHWLIEYHHSSFFLKMKAFYHRYPSSLSVSLLPTIFQ